MLLKNFKVSISNKTSVALFDMTEGQKRLSLWVCNVQILSCSLPSVENVFWYEITSRFIFNQKGQ